MFCGLPTASLPLAKLFDTPYAFAVPAYQRPYSWTTREAGQLLADLVIASGLDDDETAAPDYFLGTILLLDPEADADNGEPVRRFEVVDGQQRLVTLSILAAVLRDSDTVAPAEDGTAGASADDGAVSDLLHRMVALAGDQGTSGPASHARIALRDGERDVLDACAVIRGAARARGSEAGPADLTGIRLVQEHLAGEIEVLSREERRKLALYLMNFCHVVIIISRDIDRAHRLFTVLNERGKPLDRKDIIKAEVLRSVPVNGGAGALAQWERAQGLLGYEFETFLGHLRLIHGLQRLPIISGVRTMVRQFGSERFVADHLSPMADAFHLVRAFPLRVEARSYVKLAHSLIALNRLGKADWVPAAILAMAEQPRAPERASLLMAEIERFAHLLRLLCYGAGKRQRRFQPVIEAIRSKATDAALLAAFEITRDEQRTIQHHFKDLHRRNAGMAKLVLMRIEDELAGTPLTIDPSELTVEHVLPLRPAPTSEWKRTFPDAEVRGECQTSFGNLALVTTRQNERAKNLDFKDKVAIYKDIEGGGVVLRSNEGVLAASQWLAGDIRAREDMLLGIVSRVWRVELTR